jgi:RHS repeat-associated protein
VDETGGTAIPTHRHSGDTPLIFSATGSVVTTYRYDAFGAVRSQSSPHDNRWLFAGEQRDAESGYDYLRNRYYDPEVGRFLSVDPVTADRYVYAGANPVSRIDPLGLCWFWHDDPYWGVIALDSNDLGWGDPCLATFCQDAGRVCGATLGDLLGLTAFLYHHVPGWFVQEALPFYNQWHAELVFKAVVSANGITSCGVDSNCNFRVSFSELCAYNQGCHSHTKQEIAGAVVDGVRCVPYGYALGALIGVYIPGLGWVAGGTIGGTAGFLACAFYSLEGGHVP